MAESKRQQQVGSLIKRHFSTVLMNEGPNIYQGLLVTVTEVKMSSDLGLAKIYVSIFGTDNKMAVIEELEYNNTLLRQMLAHRIKRHVRRIPNINIYLDDTLDEMYRLRGVFDRLHDQKLMGKEEE